MTYSLTRYKNYQEYLDDESLAPHGNYRLLSTGELIEVAEENDLHIGIALQLLLLLAKIEGGIYAGRLRNGNREIQVRPVGDNWVNRKPDLVVLQPEHLKTTRPTVLLDSVPPLFVAEVVSPGGENSDNYQRDYVWKRQQYEELGILEYWVIDPHRERITVLVLIKGAYKETVYQGDERIASSAFPGLMITAEAILNSDR